MLEAQRVALGLAVPTNEAEEIAVREELEVPEDVAVAAEDALVVAVTQEEAVGVSEEKAEKDCTALEELIAVWVLDEDGEGEVTPEAEGVPLAEYDTVGRLDALPLRVPKSTLPLELGEKEGERVPCGEEEADTLAPRDAEAVADTVSESEMAPDALGEGVPITDGEVEKVELPVLLTSAVEDVVREAVSEWEIAPVTLGDAVLLTDADTVAVAKPVLLPLGDAEALPD